MEIVPLPLIRRMLSVALIDSVAAEGWEPRHAGTENLRRIELYTLRTPSRIGRYQLRIAAAKSRKLRLTQMGSIPHEQLLHTRNSDILRMRYGAQLSLVILAQLSIASPNKTHLDRDILCSRIQRNGGLVSRNASLLVCFQYNWLPGPCAGP